MEPVPSGRAGSGWAIAVLLAMLAAVTCYVATIHAKTDPAAAGDGNPILALVQHLAFLVMICLFAWHQRRVLLFLVKLLAKNWIIGGEIVFLLAIVYGAFASFGVPELFWDDSLFTVGVAGFSSAVFLGLAWFAIYLVDESRPGRRRNRRLTWDQVGPIVLESGLPSLFRLPTQGLSPRWQLGWFIAVASLPGIFLLALPAFLPAIRPSSDPRPLEWTWLAGLALGAVAPQVLLATRPISMLVGLLRLRPGKMSAPDRSVAILQHPGILLWLLGLIYVGALGVDRFQPTWIVPATLICLLLAMIAVSVAFFLSIQSRRVRICALVLVLGMFLLNGIQIYDPCYRGLNAYYPPDPLRQLFGLRSPFSGNDEKKPVDLVGFQEKEGVGDGWKRALDSRTDILEAWKASLQPRSSPGDTTARKPILVAVATCGGALRAGLWTAVVLDSIQAKIPEFSRHVRFVTGASGGMVGAALFVTSRVIDPPEPGQPAPTRAQGSLADRIDSDYLSPIARQFILRDLPYFILPWRQSYDRGHALEDALAANATLSGMDSTFARLRDAEHRGEIPSLIFSPMLVEDGRRLLISNLRLADLTTIGGEDLLSESHREIVDLLDQETPQPLDPRDSLEFRKINAVSAVEFFRLFPEAADSFKVVTAVRMNATFPVVTPAGILPTDTPRQVVDAGYYDNYGVDLASALIFSHRHWILNNTSGVLLVQIRAFRNEKQLKVLDQPILSEGMVNAASNVVSILARGVRWLTSPVTGLAEARQAVMHFRNDGQVDVLSHYFRDQRKDDPNFFKTVIFTCDTEIASSDEQQVETLNWHLSETEINLIKKNMDDRKQNQIRLDRMAAWWQQQMSSAAGVGRH